MNKKNLINVFTLEGNAIIQYLVIVTRWTVVSESECDVVIGKAIMYKVYDPQARRYLPRKITKYNDTDEHTCT